MENYITYVVVRIKVVIFARDVTWMPNGEAITPANEVVERPRFVNSDDYDYDFLISKLTTMEANLGEMKKIVMGSFLVPSMFLLVTLLGLVMN